jgi:plastocyanin
VGKSVLKAVPALLAPFLLAVCLAACGGAPQSASNPEPTLPVAKVDTATAGSISGRVLFIGKVPAMPVLDMSSNPNCEREHRTPQRAETVVVNPNRTLRYVFVWISQGLPKARWDPPASSAILDQKGCMYEPHVLGLMTGQPLEILNDDPVNHDVHAECQVNHAWNESQPPRAEHKIKTFDHEEILFPVTCNVHPWMRAWIGVSPHPFFAVTGEEGTFTLNGVPPGIYTLEAVHEQYGRKQAKVTVTPKGRAIMDFSYGE